MTGPLGQKIADGSQRAEKQPEVSSLKLQYYIERDLNEPPCRSQVGTGKKYEHVQTNLAKKEMPKSTRKEN